MPDGAGSSGCSTASREPMSVEHPAVQLPGDRGTVRERTTTVTMHLLRRLLLTPEP